MGKQNALSVGLLNKGFVLTDSDGKWEKNILAQSYSVILLVSGNQLYH